MKIWITALLSGVLLLPSFNSQAQDREFPPRVSFHRLIPDPSDKGFVALYHYQEGDWILEKLGPDLQSKWKKTIEVTQSAGMTLSFGGFASMTSRVTTDLYPLFFKEHIFLLKVVIDMARGKETISYSKYSPEGTVIVDNRELFSGKPNGPQAFQEYPPTSFWTKNTDLSPDSSKFLFYKSEPVQRKRLPAKCEVAVFDLGSEVLQRQVIKLEHPYGEEKIEGNQVQAKGVVDNQGQVFLWGKLRKKKHPVQHYDFFLHRLNMQTLEEKEITLDFGIYEVRDMLVEITPEQKVLAFTYFGDAGGRLKGYAMKKFEKESLELIQDQLVNVSQYDLGLNLSLAGVLFDSAGEVYVIADEEYSVYLNRIRFSTFPRAFVSHFDANGVLHWSALLDKRPEKTHYNRPLKGLKKYKISPCQALHLYRDKLYLYFGRILDDKPTPPAQVLSFDIHSGAEVIRHSFPFPENTNRYFEAPLLSHAEGQEGIHYLMETPGKYSDPKVVQLFVVK